MPKALTVYKASAGSGKTFTLASEYITLVVNNPQDYSRILAVTFTNKATQEMKNRILAQLYGIAHAQDDSDDYFKQVSNKTKLPEQTIRENAAVALSLLTHHYNEFRIQTIDAFFQSVLRNLARELNLTANLHIDLNDEQVEVQAVDQLINDLEEGKEVLAWIRDYIDKNIEDDQGWNVIGQIKDFGKNIFKDFYKEHQKELDECFKKEQFFNHFIADLRKRRETISKQMNGNANKIIMKLRDANVDNATLFSRYLYGYILKRAKGKPTGEDAPGYVSKCIGSPDKWVAKSCPAAERSIIIALATESLCKEMKELEQHRLSNWKEYQSCNLTLRHLSQLRLLHAISETVEDINKDTNRFMLSNTQSLLSMLMQDSDTPFVFEKMGSYIKHIMIDEFQDTSTIQWSNFRKLLDNCMAQESSHNLIVGDVKQSIYRWRQGDWKLLNNIEYDFPASQIAIEPLDTNYRSEENIVQFNNTFFNYAVRQTVNELKEDKIEQAGQLLDAYKEIDQKPCNTDAQGYICIKLFPSKDYRENILNSLTDNVSELLGKGYKQSSIAILVRSKGVIQDITDQFSHAFGTEVNIVSDEAFRLDASLAVNVIICALHLLTHPTDSLTQGKLIKLYQQQVLLSKRSNNELFSDGLQNSMNSYLPAGYTSRFEELLRMSILDLVDEIYTLFHLGELDGQSAYVCTFYDTLNEYLRDHPADIDDFIEEWEKTLSARTIQSDEIDGIRLITIHKSKGLEFDNVLIPFCDWELEKKNSNTIWCSTEGKDKPFSQLPLIPVDFSKASMTGTVFEEDYKEEHLQNTVDNMNLLYVAFTRAGKNLFVSGKRMGKTTLTALKSSPTTSNRSQVIEQILPTLADNLHNSSLEFPKEEGSPITFEYGTFPPLHQHQQENEDTLPASPSPDCSHPNPFTAPIKAHRLRIETFPRAVSFRQSNKSRDFVNGDDTETSDAKRYIKVGNILHQLFSTILTEADIEPRLKELEQEGIIYNDEITSVELREKIGNALRNVQVKEWFSTHWRLFNECTILQYDSSTGEVTEHRPDRVMTDGKEIIVVDFKFGKPRGEYQEQVHRYMRLLAEMGYPQVSGYLWYVMRNHIEKVVL